MDVAQEGRRGLTYFRVACWFVLGVSAVLLLGVLSGCGECRNDADCQDGALCEEGICQEISARREPPRGRQDCVPQEQRSCYRGPKGTANQGACKAGLQTCVAGRWAPCTGAIEPTQETCDGLDNNCDGQVDEGCACQDGKVQVCYTGNPSTRNKGLCRDGEQTCVAGKWGPCLRQVLPQAEGCDNKDNDCDGTTDNGVKRSCRNTCGIGAEICKAGKFEPCNAPKPVKEVCGDNQDNDCDGTTDEGCECNPKTRRPCYTGPKGSAGKGPCKQGMQECSADGRWQDCKGQSLPKLEACDNQDNDCNGQIDDGLKRPCQRGCNSGTEQCSAGRWQACNARPADAEICDGKDNDCNGKVDDLSGGKRCACRIGQSETCYTGPKGTLGRGTCKAGKRQCQSTGQWSLCLGENTPQKEFCDGKDNDCDGKVDNQAQKTDALRQSCYTGPSNTVGKGSCKPGSQSCTGGRWGTCLGQRLPAVESCNNKDDDCDGKVDEGLSELCYTGTANTKDIGVCRQGRRQCSAGTWLACVGEVVPSPEQCNRKDDDCDGKTDEDGACNVCKNGERRACYTGPANTRGRLPCKDGISNCIQGKWGSCINQVLPRVENCNNQDDDCDGRVDETVVRACTSVCGKGSQRCKAGAWGACSAPLPKTEVCNRKDDDCDGAIDEGLNCAVLATGDWGGKVLLWDPVKRQTTRTLTHTNKRVYSLASRPGSPWLAVGLNSQGVQIWDSKTGTKQRSYNTTDTVYTLAFSPDGKQLSAGTGTSLYFWDVTSSRTTPVRQIRASAPVRVAYHPTKDWLAAGEDQQVKFWNPKTGASLGRLSLTFTVRSLAVSPDGKSMALSGSANRLPIAELWDISGTSPRRIKSFSSSIPSTSIVVYQIAFSPDSSLVSAACPNYVFVWERASFKQKLRVSLPRHWLYSSGITADNKTLAIGGREASGKGRLYFWDLKATPPRQIFSSTAHAPYLWSLLFFP